VRRAMHLMIAAITLVVSTSASAQTRRALVIGIDRYNLFAPADVNSAPQRPFVDTLRGARADAESIKSVLESVYDFPRANVRVLLDSAATRAKIIAAIQKLTAESEKGDIVAFYYAGHGAQRYNSKSWKPTHLDETIVPADANAGGFDIRDKELAVLFDGLLDKGVTLTLIFDSCHSGAITRGGASGLVRMASIDPRDSRDDSRPISPEEKGALILSAAQDDQPAFETFAEGRDQGAFTHALVRVMRDTPKNEPAHQIYQRVKAMIQSEGSPQEPVIKGTEANKRRPLFGNALGELGGRMTVALERVDADTAHLQGGLALGFGAGTELVQLVSDKAKTPNPIRLKIVAVTGMSSSLATAVSGKASTLQPGTLFVVDKWAAPDAPVLRVFIPPAVSAAELEAATRSLGELKGNSTVAWVDDPSAISDDVRPFFLLFPTKTGWRARSPLGTTKSIASPTAADVVAAVTSLNAELAQRAAHDSMAAKAKANVVALPPLVFVVLPPTSQLRAAIHLGAGTANTAIEVADAPEQADYLLAGRLAPEGVLYAWLRPDATPAVQRRSSLPSRSSWFPAAQGVDSLEDHAIRLGRINGWLTLDSPPQSGWFPYQLAIRNVQSGATKTNGDSTYGGERYDLVLVRDSVRQPLPVRRWIYVFAIDSDGNGTPLYPQSGTVENRVPFDSVDVAQVMPAEIKLPRRTSIPIKAPYGVDTWFLVTSDEAIDVETFRFEGVRTERGVGRSGLAGMLGRVGGATRSVGEGPTPTDWSVQKIKLLSKPKPVATK
jgi:hypothetical protein